MRFSSVATTYFSLQMSARVICQQLKPIPWIFQILSMLTESRPGTIHQCSFDLCLNCPFTESVAHIARSVCEISAIKPVLMPVGLRVLAVHVGLQSRRRISARTRDSKVVRAGAPGLVKVVMCVSPQSYFPPFFAA
jgi:hypothetical protein